MTRVSLFWLVLVTKIKEFCHLIFKLFSSTYMNESFHSEFFKHSQLNSIFLYIVEKVTLFLGFELMPRHVSHDFSALGFPLSPYVPFTQMLPGHGIVAPTLVSCQVIQGVSGMALITFVLNSHKSWLFSVFLIDYKSNRELEK